MAREMKILISKDELMKRIREVANEINEFYKGEEVTLICVLKGAMMFCAELSKHLTIPVKQEFVRLSSYGSEEKSSGHVKALDLTLPNLEGKNALIVEDIIDTGLTIKFLKDYIERTLKPKSLKVAAMADKKIARQNDLYPDFYCFEVDDKFILGFGLDVNELYRNLPYIAYFE